MGRVGGVSGVGGGRGGRGLQDDPIIDEWPFDAGWKSDAAATSLHLGRVVIRSDGWDRISGRQPEANANAVFMHMQPQLDYPADTSVVEIKVASALRPELKRNRFDECRKMAGSNPDVESMKPSGNCGDNAKV